ncbi:hypothetical protein HYT56_00285 [Candidatus Woesearchaeota archaeon]|nr:hypothetical protein [Candidatus Woesearchaeota archaeon]
MNYRTKSSSIFYIDEQTGQVNDRRMRIDPRNYQSDILAKLEKDYDNQLEAIQKELEKRLKRK